MILCSFLCIAMLAACMNPKVEKTDSQAQVGFVKIAPGAYDSADTAIVIAKQEKQGRTFTSVTPLDYNDKTKEIARLQSGEVITQISLDGAAELIRAADAFKETLL